VIEAMKMEHEVRAARGGRIEQIGVRVGDQVTPGQRLVRYAGDGT
jgi:biotin carboxyl carrier protein